MSELICGDNSLPLPSSADRPGGSWLRMIVDYNPCFLLSAVSMLLGCRLLNDAMNAKAGDVHGSLLLITTINLYEVCLLAVAWTIKRYCGLRRDVGILLIVGSIFLSDLAFVIGDLSTARPGIGAIVAAVLTLLAIGKVSAALRLLESPKILRTTGVIVAFSTIALLLPIALKAVSRHSGGELPATAIYAGWWIAGGLLPIAYAVLSARSVQRLPGLARAMIVLPYVSIVGHLLACTWVFKLPFYAACYAPVLLGWRSQSAWLAGNWGGRWQQTLNGRWQ